MDKFSEKQYLMNGEPASANDLIEEASACCEKFNRDWLKSTSRAASILRKNGYTVSYNPDYVKETS